MHFDASGNWFGREPFIAEQSPAELVQLNIRLFQLGKEIGSCKASDGDGTGKYRQCEPLKLALMRMPDMRPNR
jgi:hypothetical protein